MHHHHPPDPRAKRRAPAITPTPSRFFVETPTTDTSDRHHGTPDADATGTFLAAYRWAATTRRRSLQLELRDTWLRTSTGRAA